MDEIRRKAEELFRTVVKDANNRQVPKERLIGKLETALRQARLEENKACEEICINTCSRVCTKSIDAIAKRRGEE